MKKHHQISKASQRRIQNKKAAQLFAQSFVKSRETFGSDLSKAAKLLGLNPATMKKWYKASSDPQAKKFEDVARRAASMGYLVEVQPDYSCMAEGCDRHYMREVLGSLYCQKHAYRAEAWGGRVDEEAPRRPRNVKYDAILQMVELGYSYSNAIRMAGYEGQITKQAVSQFIATQRKKEAAKLTRSPDQGQVASLEVTP